uniref:PH domain-containing protein n=1 Tax=Parascaris univalens TaxID=6257 RepID=A0A915AMW7_PARUN
MEDDNAVDIFKWIFASNIDDDLSDDLQLETTSGIRNVHVKLRGNILAAQCDETASDPLVVVVEKVRVDVPENSEDNKFPFSITFSAGAMKFFAKDEAQREKWVVKLSVCSHRMAQAELDEVADRFFNTSAPVSTAPPAVSGFSSFYLTNPFRKSHKFSLSQRSNLPSRKIYCEETMWESKLSIILPTQMVKLFLKWSQEMKEQIETRLWSIPQDSIDALHNSLRHLLSNQETYVNSLEFLESYAGPSFRPSVEKFRVAFGAVPTNLHVQQFVVENHQHNYITVGAISAIPLRFAHGGLSRLRVALHSSLNDPEKIDHILDSRFFHRRRVLLEAKSTIGSLSRRIETDWHIVSFGSIDKTGVQLLADVKQLHENLIDLINSFPGISTVVDLLCEWGRLQIAHGRLFDKERSIVPDGLDSQLDTLEASIISLNTKMAVIDSICEKDEVRKDYEKSARQALNSSLDVMLQLIDSLLDAQYLGLVLALQRPADCQLFYHIQLRSDLVLSQAVTIVVTALLNAAQSDISEWDSYPPLITVFSLLSCYGDERGMMEDARECWASLQDRVVFKFVQCSSSVSSTCIPTIGGDRSKLTVQIPLPADIFQSFPEKLRAGQWMNVVAIFWNLGINHEATFAQSLAGDSSLEETINVVAANALHAYASGRKQLDPSAMDLIAELCTTVNVNPSNKNMAIYRLAMAANFALNGIPILTCKSGKDRTSMAVTLEEGRIIRENCGINADQMGEMVVCLRRDGVRRENCRKNVGKALYSFSPFQMHFIPKELRPPAGTYSQGVAS